MSSAEKAFKDNEHRFCIHFLLFFFNLLYNTQRPRYQHQAKSVTNT